MREARRRISVEFGETFSDCPDCDVSGLLQETIPANKGQQRDCNRLHLHCTTLTGDRAALLIWTSHYRSVTDTK